jgi:hypothetical protein
MAPLSEQEVPIAKASLKAVEFYPEKQRKIAEKYEKSLSLRSIARNEENQSSHKNVVSCFFKFFEFRRGKYINLGSAFLL